MDRAEGPWSWAAVVVNYNGSVFLDACLRALSACPLRPAEVVVVDNASTDDSLEELHAWPAVHVEPSPVNLGFAGGANLGIWLTEAPVVVVLNPDVEIDPPFGRAVLDLFARDSKLGVAGAKLRYPDHALLQHAGGILHRPLLTTAHRGYREPDDGRWDEPAAVDFVTGGAMAVRRRAFEALDGFDERFWPAYYEDVDLCLRMASAGWAVRYEPSLTAVHVESVTLGQSPAYFRFFHRNRFRFALKHLSPDEWWREFVPAETRRLRGELSAIAGEDWPIRSGAEAIEELARSGGAPGHEWQALLDGRPLADAIQALGRARETRVIVDGAKPPSSLVGRLGWRLAAPVLEALGARQQVFNDAVVQALEAQDRLNRELVAELLSAMLSLGYWSRREPLAPPSPDSW